MTQIHGVAISRPLAVGSLVVLCTIFVHALAIVAVVRFFRYERKRGRTYAGVLGDLPILMLTIAVTFVAHLIEMTLWAVLFVICGEFKDFAGAFYHSAMNYSTLGYGDVIMSPSWKLLGPLEAANGALMFGVSTAIIFAVIQRLVLSRFADLRANDASGH
jgi:amino acid transporter